MYDKSYYLVRRVKYQPNPIELIIIAESPPIGGTYFYDEDGKASEALFSAMMKVLNVKRVSKEEGLGLFKKAGWFLVDATYEHLNDGRSDKQRNGVIDRDYKLLCGDLLTLSPDRLVRIVAIKKNVCERLVKRLKADGFNVLNDDDPNDWPPFPMYPKNEVAFHQRFGAILDRNGIRRN
jgi:hypothetical protein